MDLLKVEIKDDRTFQNQARHKSFKLTRSIVFQVEQDPAVSTDFMESVFQIGFRPEMVSFLRVPVRLSLILLNLDETQVFPAYSLRRL